jgi:hypothetical protein
MTVVVGAAGAGAQVGLLLGYAIEVVADSTAKSVTEWHLVVVERWSESVGSALLYC